MALDTLGVSLVYQSVGQQKRLLGSAAPERYRPLARHGGGNQTRTL